MLLAVVADRVPITAVQALLTSVACILWRTDNTPVIHTPGFNDDSFLLKYHKKKGVSFPQPVSDAVPWKAMCF